MRKPGRNVITALLCKLIFELNLLKYLELIQNLRLIREKYN